MRRSALLQIQLLDVAMTRKMGPIRTGFVPYFSLMGDASQGLFSANMWRLDDEGNQLWEWQLDRGETGLFGATFSCAEFAAQLQVAMILGMYSPSTPIGEAKVLALGDNIREAFSAWRCGSGS